MERLRSDRAAQILDFWLKVEVFSPQSIPKAQERHPRAPVFEWRHPRDPLPWDAHHPLQTIAKKDWQSWRHTVYAGIFEIGRWRDRLEKELGASEDAIDSNPGSQSCLFSFAVSDDGFPLPESFCPSAAAWAYGQTVTPPGHKSSTWLVGFEAIEKALADEFDRKVESTEIEIERTTWRQPRKTNRPRRETLKGEVGNHLDGQRLQRMLRWATEKLQVQSLVESQVWRVESQLIDNEDYFELRDSGILNSFFLSDLSRLGRLARESNLGSHVTEYLRPKVEEHDRVDLVRQPEIALDRLSPERFPKGCWPVPGRFPLVASQQIAVNESLAEGNTERPIFSVNGPPGTGKTTLLRDLVAAILVRRAEQLARLQSPQEAFVQEERWRTGDYTRVISVFQPNLVGYEIVVASTNNGAVENVSLEMPAAQSADPGLATDADPFQPFASRLLGDDAWALLSGRLGNRANCYQFCSRLIDKDERVSRPGAPETATSLPEMGLREYLRSHKATAHDWSIAKRRFQEAIKNEQRLRNQRVKWAKCIADEASVTARMHRRQLALDGLEEQLGHAKDSLAAWLTKEQLADTRKRSSWADLHSHQKLRPKLWQIFLSRGRDLETWRSRERELVARYNSAVDEKTDASSSAEGWRAEVSRLQSSIAEARRALSDAQARAHRTRASLETARQKLGSHFPDLALWTTKADTDARALSSPWADSEWNNARARVFVEAIRLHRAFVLAVSDRFRKSLDGIADILRGSVPEDAPAHAARAAWQSLFFIVPLVSTTFASFSRLFCHLGEGDIGWLLVDEAGQAPPQAAVGALWRSQRSVIVGDPRQLEPIVTLPFRLQTLLQAQANISETWLPSRSSVQALGDRLNPLGTVIDIDGETAWIGCPLLVHRRCDRPMFDISNEIAYSGLMVHAATRDYDLPLPESTWIHVASARSEGHWIPEEGRVVQKLVVNLEQAAEDWSENVEEEVIYLLSPFRTVVAELQGLVRNLGQTRLRLKPGTVHTAQGKESDVVILVLGGDPEKPGAKFWASGKPNLLNVAVSRARRRLYVVGDAERWSRYTFFGTLAARLPKATPMHLGNQFISDRLSS